MSFYDVTTAVAGTVTQTIEAESSDEARDIASEVLDLEGALDTWADERIADADEHGHSVSIEYELDPGERWTKALDE